MAKLIQRLEQWDKDFVVIVEDVPQQCPQCHANIQSYDLEFLDDGTMGDKLNLLFLADSGKRNLVEVVCRLNHVVCRALAKVMYWQDFDPTGKPESPEIGTIRTIWHKLQKSMVPELEYPNTELLEKSFLPGRLISPDIWVSDKARISSTAILIGPLLIEDRTVIEDKAICGPYAIIVNSIISVEAEVSGVVLVDNMVVRTSEY